MLNIKNFVLACFAVLALAVSPVSGVARAGDPVIDAAKDAGQVGEKIDGYLAPVSSVDPALKRKIDEINALRRQFYANLANQEGTSLVAVARVSGEKLVAGEKSGRLVYDDTGRWIKKP